MLNNFKLASKFTKSANYKGIQDKKMRYKQYYSDGLEAIKKTIQLIGYDCSVNILAKYRRRFELLSE
jgi:hypothetical protein